MELVLEKKKKAKVGLKKPILDYRAYRVPELIPVLGSQLQVM